MVWKHCTGKHCYMSDLILPFYSETSVFWHFKNFISVCFELRNTALKHGVFVFCHENVFCVSQHHIFWWKRNWQKGFGLTLLCSGAIKVRSCTQKSLLHSPPGWMWSEFPSTTQGCHEVSATVSSVSLVRLEREELMKAHLPVSLNLWGAWCPQACWPGWWWCVSQCGLLLWCNALV